MPDANSGLSNSDARPVLSAIAEGAGNVKNVLPILQEQFNLSDEDVEELIPSGTETILSNRAHWARTYLSKAGLLLSKKRNHHKITDLGRTVLTKYPDRIDNTILKSFSAFQDWQSAPPAPKQSKTYAARAIDTDETPESQISKLTAEIETILVSDVIAAVLTLSPARFEQLIVDLLIAMGYGGGDANMGESIGKSGDGGIDGLINEDALGLDAVYIQAKRYAPENKIGRPALNAFVGSLTGEGATKGVFVTTSDFSKEAVIYVERVQHRIVLINGDRLARLMIRHEVGVRARKAYVLRSVDEDYFSDV